MIRRVCVAVVGATAVLLFAGTATAGATTTTVRPAGSVLPLVADPTIAAAGDIACGASDPNYHNGNGTATACRMKYTSDLLVSGGYSGVLALGDEMQSDPSPNGFATVFNSTWGRVKPLIHPIPGNHEYGYSKAGGYFGYFGAAAGDPTKGYYSFDLGAWHIVALNSNCSKITGGCAAGSPQEVWLKSDLAAHPDRCTLAFQHHPRYSSGHEGDSAFMADLYQDLYNAHADVLLSGHSHDYERFAPQDNAAHLDNARGIRQFVVGTGGAFFTGLGTRHANSVTSQNTTFGVLALTLHQGSYDWNFRPEAGKTWTDSGSATCHASSPPASDFALSASPSSATVQAGTGTSSTISSTATGATQSVRLSASGLPSGATASFAPQTITSGQSSTMTVTTSASTPAGTSTVTVTGTATVTRTTPFTLTVTSGSPPPPPTGPTLVQSGGATETAAATSLTTTLPTASGAGHLLVLSAGVYTGLSNRITSVTDSAGNTWTKAGAFAVSGHNSDGELWYAANARPVTTVTARTSSAAVMALSVLDFAGVATSSPVDVLTGTSATSTTPASGAVTTTPGGLAVGFIAGHANTQAITVTATGFTALAQRTSAAGTPTSDVSAYRTVGAGSTVTMTGRLSAAVYWAAGVVVFRAA